MCIEHELNQGALHTRQVAPRITTNRDAGDLAGSIRNRACPDALLAQFDVVFCVRNSSSVGVAPTSGPLTLSSSLLAIRHVVLQQIGQIELDRTQISEYRLAGLPRGSRVCHRVLRRRPATARCPRPAPWLCQYSSNSYCVRCAAPRSATCSELAPLVQRQIAVSIEYVRNRDAPGWRPHPRSLV